MRVKGSILRARLLFARARGAEEQVLDELSPELRTQAEDGFMQPAWHEMDELIELTEAIVRTIGGGQQSVLYEAGTFACEENLRGVYRVFLKIGFIQLMLKRVSQAWSVQFDSGRMVVANSSKRTARLALHDVPQPSAVHCLPIAGWVKRAAELAGCRDVSCEVSACRLRGDPACHFDMRWR